MTFWPTTTVCAVAAAYVGSLEIGTERVMVKLLFTTYTMS